MSRTYRNLKESKSIHKPQYKWKLLAGKNHKQVITDWDDKPIAAVKEIWRPFKH